MSDRDAAFNRVWQVVREWDISTERGPNRLYEGINGDHVRAILRAAFEEEPAAEIKRLTAERDRLLERLEEIAEPDVSYLNDAGNSRRRREIAQYAIRAALKDPAP